MIRFPFSLRHLVGTPRRQPAAAPRIRPPRDEAGPDDTPNGPGWFDSSWQLGRGLEVREGLPEGRSHDWLEACLNAQRAPRAAAARRKDAPGARRAAPTAMTAAMVEFDIAGLELVQP